MKTAGKIVDVEAQILELRRICFPRDYEQVPPRDIFDKRSWHCVLKMNEEICAYSRLVPGPSGVFEAWTKGKAEIPTGKEIVDLNRVLVSPAFQGRGLFKRQLVESVCVAFDLKFDAVVGSVRPGNALVSFVFELGFKASGPIVQEFNAGVHPIMVQPIVLRRESSTEDRLRDLKDMPREDRSNLDFDCFQFV